jgi:RNA polymerase sigma-70 factor, ECF subfamily
MNKKRATSTAPAEVPSTRLGPPVIRSVADEDCHLVAEVQAGSVEAFGQLYERYADRAYRVAMSLSRDKECAEDAVHDAFISIWRGAASYRPERGPVAAWLLVAVRHRAIDSLRRDGRAATDRRGDACFPAVPVAVPDQVVALDESRRLRGHLGGLPQAQQEVIVLAFYGGLTHTEIAEALGLPPGTVKGRMRLGLQKLRDVFESTAA